MLYGLTEQIPICKLIDDLSAEGLTVCYNSVFSEYGLPKNIVFNSDTNLISEKFQSLCSKLNMCQIILSFREHICNIQLDPS